jgi:ribosomal protein S1
VTNDGEPSTPAIRLADLQPKQQLTGTVTRLELFGAFVDVGAERKGLIHISQLGPNRVNRVEEVLSAGQEVTAWVKRVDAAAGRLELTLIQPIAVEWDELAPGRVFKGKVVRLEKFGAFVDIGAERPGLVHVSELGSAGQRVGHPSEVVRVGEELEVKVLSVERKKRQLNLSVKALETVDDAPEPEADVEPSATAMELALRDAMRGRNPRQAARYKKRGSRDQDEREEIFARTLRQHRDRDDE